MTIYVILFMIPLAFYIEREEYSLNTKLLVFIIFTFLIVGLRANTVDRDYMNYVNGYIKPVKTIVQYAQGASFTIEPGIDIISSIITKELKLGYQWVFLTFAILGLSLKLESFRRIGSEFFFASLLLHFSNTLYLHEFTQIRISIAIALFLFSIQDIFEKRLLMFFFKISLAMLFHYSIIIVLPLYYVFRLVQGNKKVLMLLLLLVLLIIASAGIWKPVLFRLVPRFQRHFNSAPINYLNPLVFMRLGIIALSLWGSDIKKDFDQKSLFYLSVYALGIGVFYFFHKSAGLGLRLSQILFAIDPVAIPYLLKRFRVGTRSGIIVAVSMSMFLANMYLINIVKPYGISFDHLLPK